MVKSRSSLSKQVLFLSKSILTFFILSIVIFLNYVDLKDIDRDGIYLNLLKDIAEKHYRSELLFKDYELERLDTLRHISPTIFETHNAARIKIVNLLKVYGDSITRISKGEVNNSGKRNSIFNLMTEDSTRIRSISKNSIVSKKKEELSLNHEYYGDREINEAVNICDSYNYQPTVYILYECDTMLLIKKCENLLEQWNHKNKQDIITLRTFVNKKNLINRIHTQVIGNPRTKTQELDKIYNGTGGGNDSYSDVNTGKEIKRTSKNILFTDYLVLLGVTISQDSLFLNVIDKNDAREVNPEKSGQQGGSGKPQLISIPIKTQRLVLPSILVFAGYPSNYLNQLSDTTKEFELKNSYGNVKLKMVESISEDIYKKNNEPISIFGFDLSRKWFPIALFITLNLILVKLFSLIKTARKQALQIISESETEDALSFLIESKSIRFILWVLSPLIIFALIISSASIHYTGVIFYIMFVCCIISTFLGAVTYKLSLKM